MSRLSAAHGADAVEEAKAFAMRHAEDAKRLRVTVREQMELLTFQVEKADIKVGSRFGVWSLEGLRADRLGFS